MARKSKDLTEQRFGRLVAKSVLRRNGRKMWLCLCDCGNHHAVSPSALVHNQTRSCGCLQKESARSKHTKHTTHGLSHTPIGHTWATMRARCNHPQNPSYYKYGGRGIRVCEFLNKSPWSIVEVIGDRPNGNTLDRIDGKLGYWCGKCRECIEHGWVKNIQWATPKEQAQHMSSNRLVTIDGATKCVTQWATEVGISPNVIQYRLKKGITGTELLKPISHTGRPKQIVTHEAIH